MSSRKIETIVFDLGGVLIDWNPRYLYRKLFTDKDEMERFLSEVCHSDWNLQQDAGHSFAQAIEERCAVYPQYKSQISAYFERWPEMVAGDIPGTVAILESLRQQNKHKIYALSNWSAETFPVALARFDFFKCFDEILLSGKEKLIKPDPRFFALLTERFNVDPETSIFIDDVEKNVEAARQIGFRAIRFTDPESLHHSLERFGVLLDPMVEK